ncbi:malonyl-ACP O-methyltransferase BioC [Brevibacillus agri]|uniref:malonyl-ACP O-methyltransferase BioC n=1 Tax=Brevibacillus sp. NSP2.1 TaxID=3003229 RepID=UPI0004167BA1|nr:malonyl-ACP O-methyltransferase BioC [Brevibacillus sp. NSP2.1]QHZ54643.1 malonyl-ACP O-methyltransferase BioC [Brevibacillus sp. NSP2.1]
MHRNTVKHRFSNKAAFYEQYAIVQKEMANRLSAMVQTAIPRDAVASILEVGCGTGGLTRLIRSQYPHADYEAIDLAAGMIAQAQASLARLGLTGSFYQADAEEWVWTQPAACKDLIVSGACFQWFFRPEQTIRGLCRLLAPNAPLYFSTFGPDTFCELHDSFAHAHASLGEKGVRHGLSFLSAEQWLSMLEAAGMSSLRATTQKVVLAYPGVSDFLHAVKAVGANASEDKSAGLGRRRLLLAMMDYYERTYGGEHGVRVTYDLLYISGVRQPRP